MAQAASNTEELGSGLEDGALLPVLRRASHADLREIAESLNRGLDVFITWDSRIVANKEDLTAIPEVIAAYVLRAGGHSIRNYFRGGGPEYREIVRDVCAVVKAPVAKDEHDIVRMELAYLQTLLDNAVKGLSVEQKQELLEKMKQSAGRAVSFDDVVKGGALLGLLMPLIFAAIAQQTFAKAAAAGAQMALGKLAGGVAGPIGLVAGTVWLAVDLAGPSYRATIPAVAQIALLRQRMLWEG